MSPSTFPGKLIGGLCALCGIFILTLPIPIVVNSFASYYKNRLWRNEVRVIIVVEVCRTFILTCEEEFNYNFIVPVEF